MRWSLSRRLTSRRITPPLSWAANMSAIMDDTDKVQQFHEDTIANKLEVLPPDIHASEYRFVPVDERRIRYGLGAVKGTGESAIEHIIEARAAGPFKTFSISAFGWTGASSTAGSSNRWCGPVRSIRSTIIAPACWPRSALPWKPRNRPAGRLRRSACSAKLRQRLKGRS